jgi:hypothetical protein
MSQYEHLSINLATIIDILGPVTVLMSCVILGLVLKLVH